MNSKSLNVTIMQTITHIFIHTLSIVHSDTQTNSKTFSNIEIVDTQQGSLRNHKEKLQLGCHQRLNYDHDESL